MESKMKKSVKKNAKIKKLNSDGKEYNIKKHRVNVESPTGKKVTLGMKLINFYNGLDLDGKIRFASKVVYSDSTSQFRRLFLIFMFYSFIGTLAENFVEIVIRHWYFMPREFFRLPICPIFGFGAIVLFMFFDKFLCNPRHNMNVKIVVVFVFSVLITSGIEYMASHYLEMTTGTWPWKDYANQPFNLEGRICLFNSIGFGVLATICILWIQPRFEYWLLTIVHKNVFNIIFYIMFIAFLLDFYFAIKYPTGVDLSKKRESWAMITNYVLV